MYHCGRLEMHWPWMVWSQKALMGWQVKMHTRTRPALHMDTTTMTTRETFCILRLKMR